MTGMPNKLDFYKESTRKAPIFFSITSFGVRGCVTLDVTHPQFLVTRPDGGTGRVFPFHPMLTQMIRHERLQFVHIKTTQDHGISLKSSRALLHGARDFLFWRGTGGTRLSRPEIRPAFRTASQPLKFKGRPVRSLKRRQGCCPRWSYRPKDVAIKSVEMAKDHNTRGSG